MLIEFILSLSIALSAQAVQVPAENYYLTEAVDTSQQLNIPKFTSTEFKNLWYDARLFDVEIIEKAPNITGNQAADKHIHTIAEERGYRLQRTSDISGIHPLPNRAFTLMQQAAREENIKIEVVSGFRSVPTQRSLFLMRLHNEISRGFNYADIPDGVYDTAIKDVLSQTALPGYSKHHSGYAIDLRDANSNESFVNFSQTESFDWLSRDNYMNAKRFGFIPSYPAGAKKQGPEPESWEYTWIGVTNFHKND